MSEIVERLNKLASALFYGGHEDDTLLVNNAIALIEQQAREIADLRARLREWQECAKYDPVMEGPVFCGWDRSALERCRRNALEKSNVE